MSKENERSFVPPQKVRTTALRGFTKANTVNRGATELAYARAQSLIDGAGVHLGVLKRMHVFFKRNEDFKDVKPVDGNGQIAWELNGGDAGRAWVSKILAAEELLEKRFDKETLAVIQAELTEPANAPDFMVQKDDAEPKRFDAILKGVNEELGLVAGWAIICKEDGEDYYDVQGDHIPEFPMFKSAYEYMVNGGDAKVMHAGKVIGKVIFAWPETTEMAKAFGDAKPKITGLKIMMKPIPSVLKDFKSGKLKGFSIGGFYGETEEVN